MPGERRLGQALNAALHAMLDRHRDMYVLGEDIADPYGGAFKITKGLTTAYPDRVRTTPISENAIVGVANGLALCGNRVVVEMMFGDFITLAFDQLVNFAAKTVSMYGQEKHFPLVVRCPVGGRRGYGPTHSQSLQKHFIGVPGLELYELSTLHEPEYVLETAFQRGRPAIVFEQKVLYGRRLHPVGRIDDTLTSRRIDDNWVHVAPAVDGPEVSVVLVAGGAIAEECMDAQRALLREGIRVALLVPARIFPLDLEPVLPLIESAGLVAVAEEGTAGGTWGAEVAATLHQRLWGALRQPVRLLHSADRTIPAAVHLEDQMLLQPAGIAAAVADLLRVGRVSPRRAAAPAPERHADQPGARLAAASTDQPVARPAAAPTGRPGAEHRVVLARLNTNDTEYTLVEWLVADGAVVAEGDSIAEVETSKTIEVVTANAAGVLRHGLTAGSPCEPGETIASIGGGTDSTTSAEPVVAATPVAPAPAREDADVVALSSAQRRVARVVTVSRQSIPDAFVLREVSLAGFDVVNAARVQADEDPLGLLETVVAVLGRLPAEHRICFATLTGDEAVRLPEGINVGVTLDAGRGLFVPVVRGVDRRSFQDIADDLADLRMDAFRGELTEDQLSDANIAVSWNHEPGVVMVQPVIPPGLACALSVGGRLEAVAVRDGRAVSRPVLHLGLAHDHRFVNGREAVAFLAAVAQHIEDETMLSTLAGAAG
ncbi:2-oxo acid dehydrogenase subunit E2 [Krasilnikovia sp. M28-CT-15]|uniref:2-oxo acid dehydrogenase subunit E2 n=1 Tax=Krasilnikovia sp. M28-CT-15 TaxID=3373540 RepID=UPI003875FCD1